MPATSNDPSAALPPPIVAHLLGETTLAVGERALPKSVWPRRIARDLLLLLLVTPGHRVQRDVALDTLWPEASPEAAANHLSKALHALRRVLEPGLTTAAESTYIQTVGELIAIPPSPGCVIDLDRMLDYLAAARAGDHGRREALRAAVACFGGDLIADEPYADWLIARRERVRRLWLAAVLDLAELDRAAGEPLLTLPALELARDTEPTAEAVHRAIIRAYTAAGQPEAALRQYDRCVALLREELQTEPSGETTALADQARASLVAAPTAARPRFRPLPVPPTPLVGREQEWATIEDLLGDARCRLVTLTGPGGIGKTHLALAAGASVAADLGDGANFVSLATLRDPAYVLPAIARAVGVREEADEPLADRLADALRDCELLLVLDNVEPVIEAAPQIADLLAAAPGLKVLATSRERLRIRGEREIAIGPLPTPDPVRLPSLPSLRRFASIALFAERAVERRPGFAVDETNARAVAAICRRLDGIPLAIELAAARADDLSPEELLDRLARRLPLLVDGPRDLPARLQTMRDAIAWSYDLLPPVEQALFRRLSVFAGGFTEELAEAVGRAQGDRGTDGQGDGRLDLLSPRPPVPLSPSVFDGIASLVDKNLVRRMRDAEPRFEMLETIREFGLDRLADAGEAAAVARVHAAAFVALVADAEPGLIGPDQMLWLDRLEEEHDNLRAALAWALAAGDGEAALRLGGPLWRFWSDRGLSREGREWLRRALEIAGEAETAIRARALRAAGLLAEDLGDHAEARSCHEAALATWEALGDRAGMATAYDDLGSLAHNQGDFVRGDELHRLALRIATEIGERRVMLSSRNNLGVSAHHRGDLATAKGHYLAAREIADDRAMHAVLTVNLAALAAAEGSDEEAIRLGEEALVEHRRLGADRGVADALMILAAPLMRRGSPDRALACIDEALVRYGEMDDRYGRSVALLVLGEFARDRGDLAAALARLHESLGIAREIGNRVGVAESLEQIGETLRRQGDPRRAAALFGTAAALRDEIGAARTPAAERDYDAWLSALRAELDDSAIEDALVAGRAASLDAVLDSMLATRAAD